MNTIVVGGGISGLYMSKRLLEKDPDTKIQLMEASGRLGGRIYTQHQGLFDMGAKRISERHHKTIRLLQELGLGNRLDFKDQYQSKQSYYINGQFCDNMKSCFGKKGLYQMLSQVYENNKTPDMYRFTTRKWLLNHGLDRSMIQELETAYGFTGEFDKSNASEGIPYILSLLNPRISYTECVGGLTQATDRLSKRLYRNSHLRILLDTRIDKIKYQDGVFTVYSSGTEIGTGKSLILALPPHALAHISFRGLSNWDKIKDLLQYKVPVKLLRVYGVFHQAKLFHKCPPVMTDLPCTSIEPIHVANSKKSYAMLAYCDEEKVDYIANLIDSGTFSSNIKNWLRQIYPRLKHKLTKSTRLDISQYEWDPAGYYTRRGIKHQELNKELRIPYRREGVPLFIVGDTYSNLPLWIEGSLASVDHVLKFLGKLSDGKYNSKSQSKKKPNKKNQKKEKDLPRGLKHHIKPTLDRLFKGKCNKKWTKEAIQSDPNGDYLLVLGGYVLNIKQFLRPTNPDAPSHPGGEAILRGSGTGEDWTWKFSKVSAHQGKLSRITRYLENNITCVGVFIPPKNTEK